jgi:hypothetical protein
MKAARGGGSRGAPARRLVHFSDSRLRVESSQARRSGDAYARCRFGNRSVDRGKPAVSAMHA